MKRESTQKGKKDEKGSEMKRESTQKERANCIRCGKGEVKDDIPLKNKAFIILWIPWTIFPSSMAIKFGSYIS